MPEMLDCCQPIYVRKFLQKMAEAIQVGEIDVSAVLRLCKWVVTQPPIIDTTEDTATSKLVDKGWDWTRNEVCRLVETMCKAASDKGPRYAISDYRETICSLLESLTRDSAKSNLIDAAERENPRTYDFVTSAINSPRGTGVEALMAYARWVAEQVQQEEAGRKVIPDGFGVMPEVKAMLDWQISTENASYEASAIIGTYIGLLYWIDPSWVKENAPRIFDLAAIERAPNRAFGWAAWNAFLVWGQVHVDFYRLLRSQYVYAVEHLSEAKIAPNADATPLHHLGEHLIILDVRGDLSADEVESLLHGFLRNAIPDIRSQTMAFVGQSLRDETSVPAAVIARFQDLWDWYWPEFGRVDVKARPQCGFFAAWFTSKQFPDEWCIERIEQILEYLPLTYEAREILNRLAELTDTHLAASMRILDKMVRADKEGDMVYVWRESAEGILTSAMRGDEIVRGMAMRLIDYLGRRGYVEFGKLLQAR